MPHSLDQILPSLQSLGLWSYWIIGASAMLEAFFATGLFVPGILMVAAGGMLVHQGALDYLDLVWFVGIGSFLGCAASYWAGMLARKGLARRRKPISTPQFRRARRLLERRGALALVIGRLLGPISGFIALAAALAGMRRRKFVLWNAASAMAYALLIPLAGYYLGDFLIRFGPLATRVSLFATGVALVLAVLWWLVLRIARMLPFVLSILRSISRAIAENEDVRAWASRHPRMAAFIAHRFDTSRFSGLTTTLLAAAILYVLNIWLQSMFSFIMADAIVQADIRLANLIHAFWTPWLIRLFTHVTALGDVRVVLALLVAMLIWLQWRRRPDLMLGLFVSLIGEASTVALLKRIFQRPRPELAYFVETSGSFPSGHAAVSVALYGMLSYVMWRLGWLKPLKATLLAVTLAFLIGLSRLYLIEHYLSDVLNGWLVGTLWMLIGIAIAQWWHATRPLPAAKAPQHSLLPAGAAVLLIGFALWQVADYEKARNIVVAQEHEQTVSDIAELFASGAAPNETESVFGNPLEPINVIVIADDADAVKRAMKRAGWIEALRPTLASLTRAGLAALTNSEDADAPITPYFWQALPNDFAFQKPTSDKSLRKRHHIRFWRTRFRMPDGRQLFVAAASFDDGLDWQLLHHIDPNIDAERDLIVHELTAAGEVKGARMLAISMPRLGQSIAGDPWFTDGKAALMVLK